MLKHEGRRPFRQVAIDAVNDVADRAVDITESEKA